MCACGIHVCVCLAPTNLQGDEENEDFEDQDDDDEEEADEAKGNLTPPPPSFLPGCAHISRSRSAR
jgi:hypothetical protein